MEDLPSSGQAGISPGEPDAAHPPAARPGYTRLRVTLTNSGGWAHLTPSAAGQRAATALVLGPKVGRLSEKLGLDLEPALVRLDEQPQMPTGRNLVGLLPVADRAHPDIEKLGKLGRAAKSGDQLRYVVDLLLHVKIIHGA